MRAIPLLAGLAASAALAGCGRETPSENIAEHLEEAADHSTPEAAEVLENAAETVREEDLTDPQIGDTAMQRAGNAQAPATPPPAQGE